MTRSRISLREPDPQIHRAMRVLGRGCRGANFGSVIEGEDGELVLSEAKPKMVYFLRDHPDAIGKSR